MRGREDSKMNVDDMLLLRTFLDLF